MRWILSVGMMLWFVSNACLAQDNDTSTYRTEIIQIQEELNEHYRNEQSSPLSEADRLKFKEHPFFEIDPKYCVVARLDMSQADKKVKFKTKTDRKPEYIIYGKAIFTIDSKEYALNIYRHSKMVSSNPKSTRGFIPFNDLTNGVETYGGGRYLDVELDMNADTVVIDFNKSYHPYCAYADGYSCPVPPRENNLDVVILVGVKL